MAAVSRVLGRPLLGVFADDVDGGVERMDIDRLNLLGIADFGPKLQSGVDGALRMILCRPEFDVG